MESLRRPIKVSWRVYYMFGMDEGGVFLLVDTTNYEAIEEA